MGVGCAVKPLIFPLASNFSITNSGGNSADRKEEGMEFQCAGVLAVIANGIQIDLVFANRTHSAATSYKFDTCTKITYLGIIVTAKLASSALVPFNILIANESTL